MPERYDVIIIGSGAGGGTLAHTVAPSGKRILLLERGNFLPREMDNWDPDQVFIDGKYISNDTWYDADGKPFQPQVHYFVGGATKLYGAALYRLRPQDFGELKHIDGISPAWPLSYDDFEPLYTKAEWLYQVHGNHGEDPTEGPGASSIRGRRCRTSPASSSSPTSSRRAGTTRSTRRAASCSTRPSARSTCIRCTWCDGYPCLVHAKADAETIAVRPILDLPNVTLLVGAEVDALETDTAGRTVTACRRARAAARPRSMRPTSSSSRPAPPTCGQVPAALGQRQAPERSRQRLRSGRAELHVPQLQGGRRAGEGAQRHVFQKTLGINDFYFGADGYDFPVGNIQMVGKSNAEAMKGEEPKLTKLAPHWSLAESPRHAVDFWLTTEDVPKPDNRVTLDGDGNVHFAYKSTNDKEADRLYHELKEILNHIGMADHHVLDKNFYMHMDIPIAGVAHQAGTCRFGRDPATSVARRELQVPTRSTTCTSSTRASSRASAP